MHYFLKHILEKFNPNLFLNCIDQQTQILITAGGSVILYYQKYQKWVTYILSSMFISKYIASHVNTDYWEQPEIHF